MSGWQVGDLALCIKLGDWKTYFESGAISKGFGPPAGAVLTVRAVYHEPRHGIVLRFLDFPDSQTPGWTGFQAVRFRKVTPGTDIEGVEERRRIPVGEPA